VSKSEWRRKRVSSGSSTLGHAVVEQNNYDPLSGSRALALFEDILGPGEWN